MASALGRSEGTERKARGRFILRSLSRNIRYRGPRNVGKSARPEPFDAISVSYAHYEDYNFSNFFYL